MIFLEFKDKLAGFGIFSTKDVKKFFPRFDRRRLSEWQNKNYILKLRNSWYCFPEYLINKNSHWLIANLIHTPSYISLETVMSWYQIIPEGAFSITSVTTNKPSHFEIQSCHYYYNTVKPALFFGYRFLEIEHNTSYRTSAGFNNTRQILIAEPEKAILDFMYLHPCYKSEKDFYELRLNSIVMKEEIDENKLNKYLEKFKSPVLEKRIAMLYKTLL